VVFTAPYIKYIMSETEISKKNNRNGKGSLYRIPVGDSKYKENYNKIFKKDRDEFNRKY
tara:strand:- start:230 stop:406 length:177 start_codon:yes stop_codon:yes gene_type:complete